MIKITIGCNGFLIQSTIEVGDDIVSKLQNPENQQAIEKSLKDFDITHKLVEQGDVITSKIVMTVQCNNVAEKDIKEAERKHQDFLEFVSTLPKSNETDIMSDMDEEKILDVDVQHDLQYYTELISKIKKDAAKNGIEIISFVKISWKKRQKTRPIESETAN